MNKFIMKFGSMFAAIALMITAANVNSTCSYWMHQPELPKGAEKLKKI